MGNIHKKFPASIQLAHASNLFKHSVSHKQYVLVYANMVLQLVSKPSYLVLVSFLHIMGDRVATPLGCCCFTGSSTPGWDADLDHAYMMDVIEEIGFDVSHRCYWDFGRWSDLCRVWRPAGDDLQFEQAIDFEVSCMSCWPSLFIQFMWQGIDVMR